jgi:hypothetical protein
MTNFQTTRLTFTVLLILTGAFLLIAILTKHGAAQQPNNGALSAMAHPLLTDEFIATYQKLQAPWQQHVESPLSDAMNAVSTAYGLKVWIDPSLPRDRVIVATKNEATFSDMLGVVAKSIGAEVVPLEGIVMLVPSERASAIWSQYCRDRVTASGTAWIRPTTAKMEWETGASSVAILKRFCTNYKVRDEWVETVDADLWPAFSFAQTSPLAISTCLLGAVDKQLDFVDSSPSMIPRSIVAGGDSLSWLFTGEQLKKLGDAHCKAWKAKYPGAVEVAKNRSWQVTASPQAHLDFVRPLIPTVKYQKSSKENALYQGEIRGTLGQALADIARIGNLEYSPWPLPENVTQREIHVRYQNANLDKILSELATAGRVVLKRQGTKCSIEVLD